MKYTPIFTTKDSKERILIAHTSFLVSTIKDAVSIGFGGMLVECPLLGLNFNHKDIMEIPENDNEGKLILQKGEINGYPVWILPKKEDSCGESSH